MFIIPIASADTTWVSDSFGGSVDVIGASSVTTNATTSDSYTSTTLNGYISNDGTLNTQAWFEWGLTTSYGQTSYVQPEWTSNSTIDLSADVGIRSTPCIFNMSGTYYLISGENDGVFNGYKWSSGSWSSYSDIVDGLTDVGLRSTPTVFQIGSTWYLLSGEYSNNINGYHWDGSQWQTNSTIDDGFVFGGASNYGPHAFWLNGELYCLVGESSGNTQGYKWNSATSSWDSYNTIESGLGFADNGRFSVYQKDATYYLIEGQYNGNFDSYEWTGSTWSSDSDISQGLQDTGTYSAPSVFEMNDMFYIITGRYDGQFDAYHWNETTYNTGDEFSESIFSLTPDTTYHYRAVSENAVGRTNGSDQTFTTLNSVTINDTTSISDTSVQANGYILHGAPTAGFWIHTESNISATNFTINTTAEVSGNEIYKTITSLQPGQYYYIKAWQQYEGFRNSTATSYFMTRPQSPTSITSTMNPTNITLSWTNGSHQVSNYKTIVRYSSSSYPTTITGGDGGINTTETSHTFTSLDYNQQYFFSLWSYINASGSPTFHAYSPSKTTYSDETEGGSFNLTIRYENTTHQPVNLSKGYFHELIVHFTDSTKYLYFDDQGEIDTTKSTLSYLFNDTVNGTIEITSPSYIREIEFYWNYSHDTDFSEQNTYDTTSITDPTATNWISLSYTPTDPEQIDVSYINQSNFGDYIYTVSSDNWQYHDNDTIEVTDASFSQDANTLRAHYTFSPTTPYRCHRIIIPENQSSGNLYIYTDKEIYSETTGDYTKQNRLIPYNYYFMDTTGEYSSEDDNTYCVIYIKDADGNNLIIHSEYLFSGGQLWAYPQLLYNKNYYLSVFSDSASSILGNAPTGRTIEPQIVIQEATEMTTTGTNKQYGYRDIVTHSYYRTDTKIQYNYSDLTVAATSNVSFMMYYISNNTLIDASVEYAESNSYDYKYFDVEGYNASEDYYLVVRTIIDSDDEDFIEYNGTYYLFLPFYYDYNYSQTSDSWIDTLFTNLFGDSPLYRTDDGHTNDYVPWSYIFLFIIAFITMVTFSRKNGFVGMLATGMVIILMSAVISGLNVLYSDTTGYGPIITGVVGGLMVAVAIVGIIGGIDTR